MEAHGPETSRSHHHGVVERLALDDRCALLDLAGHIDVGNHQPHQIATAKLAVDGKVEERKVLSVARDLEPDADHLDMLWHQRALLAGKCRH